MTEIPTGDAGETRPGSRGLSSTLLAAIVVAVVCLVVAAVVVIRLAGDEGSETVEVIVPPGTAARAEAGEEVELLPRRLEVKVGDSLIIENQDEVAHQVGPYIVGPGQRIEQVFDRPGVIEGVCTLHPSGEVSIVVT